MPARPLRVFLLLSFVTTLLLFVGCGRSTLEGYELLDDGGVTADARPDSPSDSGGDARDSGRDGGRDAADAADAADAHDASDGGTTCDALSCPSGCCDATGECRRGTELTACGGGGGTACVDCLADGFDFCDANGRVCAREVPVCNSTTCPDGCCGTSSTGVRACLEGTGAGACGRNGESCKACSGDTRVCDLGTRTCVEPICNAGTCSGCCHGTECRTGLEAETCGVAGSICVNCTTTGMLCAPINGLDGGATGGGRCEGAPPQCNAQTCPTGCCVGNTCVPGTADTSCGVGGGQCANCAGEGRICTNQACVVVPPSCNADNCPGCCSGNTCFAGFVNARCGSNGNTCVNCSALDSQCNLAATPRVCNDQQTTCPAPYPSCPAEVTTTPPINAQVCDQATLQDANAACAPGADSASCNAFFDFIGQVDPSCGQCLTPYHHSFLEVRAIYTCVQPFVNASCNHDTGCATDCTDDSCGSCADAASRQQCENSTRSSGQCSALYGRTTCIGRALFSTATFCNPALYRGDYGAWLQGVGDHYCGR